VGHHITGLVLATPWDEAVRARFDLVAVPLRGVTMFHIDHYYSAYWRATLKWPGTLERPPGCSSLFPDDAVLAHIASELAGEATPTFGVIQTDYFGGAGEQWAALYTRTHRTSGDETSINAVLRMLGIVAAPGLDEFDTVGLGEHRRSPNQLGRYVELCEALGV